MGFSIPEELLRFLNFKNSLGVKTEFPMMNANRKLIPMKQICFSLFLNKIDTETQPK
jgi:hypothetical protein